ncbi:MAG: MFS transporter [bacterium]
MQRLSTFESLRYRNFRLFWFGQFMSLIGSWMQTVGQGWLVLELTNSSFLLGLVSAIGSLPVLFLSIFAGVVADKVRKRNLIIVTQTSLTILAFSIGIITYMGIVKFWHILVIVALFGVANAFDMPARQTFVVELVDKESLMNAIALNSSIFNGARIIGPAIAGVMVSSIGVAGCFILNAISFIPVIVGLSLIDGEFRVDSSSNDSVIESLKGGFLYLKENPNIFFIIIMVAINSVFGMPYITLMPVFARDVFKVGAQGLGFLMSATGVGALIGALFIASIGRYKYKGRLLITGIIGFSIFLLLFTITRSFTVAIWMLVFTGFCMIVFTSTANTTVQTYTQDDMRGRVMSFYTTFFTGMAPLGNLQAGYLANLWGAPKAIFIGAVMNIVIVIVILLKLPDIKNL